MAKTPDTANEILRTLGYCLHCDKLSSQSSIDIAKHDLASALKAQLPEVCRPLNPSEATERAYLYDHLWRDTINDFFSQTRGQ